MFFVKVIKQLRFEFFLLISFQDRIEFCNQPKKSWEEQIKY